MGWLLGCTSPQRKKRVVSLPPMLPQGRKDLPILSSFFPIFCSRNENLLNISMRPQMQKASVVLENVH